LSAPNVVSEVNSRNDITNRMASCDLDTTQVLMDISATGTSGYQALDWLRENCQLDFGLSDHRRILATMSFADDKHTADRLVAAVTRWREAASDFAHPAVDRTAVAK